MIFRKKSDMKSRQMYVTVFNDTDTIDGVQMADVELNANFVSNKERYKSLHLFNRPFKDDKGEISYMNAAPYSDSEIEKIKDAAGDNYIELFDDEGNVIGKTYGVTASATTKKINDINVTKIDFDEDIKKAKFNVTEDFANDQVLYEKNIASNPENSFSDKKLAGNYDSLTLKALKTAARSRHMLVYGAMSVAGTAFNVKKETRQEAQQVIEDINNVIEFGG